MSDDHIPFLRPNLVPHEAYGRYLDEIDSNHLYTNYGPLNRQFESELISRVFDGHGAAATVSNATMGLVLSIARTRRPGAKYAVLPSFTFAATPLAAEWAGLEPYFVDVDPSSWSVTASELGKALDLLGDEVAVVVPYAAFGDPLDLTPFADLHRNGTPVVVDAAASLGTRFAGRAWCADFPGAVVYSLHATKPFGIGEGGLVYSSDATLVERIRRSCNFGFDQDRETEHQGLNAKLSEYAAAVGLATLDVFPAKTAERIRIAAQYRTALESRGAFERGWRTQVLRGVVPYQFFPVVCPPDLSNADVVTRLKKSGVSARTYFGPGCHQHPHFANRPRADLPVTEDLARRIVSLPLWEGMTEGTVARVVKALLA